MRKITINTHRGLFSWLLKSKRNVVRDDTLSQMVKVLIEEHNDLVDEIQKLKDRNKKYDKQIAEYEQLLESEDPIGEILNKERS